MQSHAAGGRRSPFDISLPQSEGNDQRGSQPAFALATRHLRDESESQPLLQPPLVQPPSPHAKHHLQLHLIDNECDEEEARGCTGYQPAAQSSEHPPLSLGDDFPEKGQTRSCRHVCHLLCSWALSLILWVHLFLVVPYCEYHHHHSTPPPLAAVGIPSSPLRLSVVCNHYYGHWVGVNISSQSEDTTPAPNVSTTVQQSQVYETYTYHWFCFATMGITYVLYLLHTWCHSPIPRYLRCIEPSLGARLTQLRAAEPELWAIVQGWDEDEGGPTAGGPSSPASWAGRTSSSISPTASDERHALWWSAQASFSPRDHVSASSSPQQRVTTAPTIGPGDIRKRFKFDRAVDMSPPIQLMSSSPSCSCCDSGGAVVHVRMTKDTSFADLYTKQSYDREFASWVDGYDYSDHSVLVASCVTIPGFTDAFLALRNENQWPAFFGVLWFWFFTCLSFSSLYRQYFFSRTTSAEFHCHKRLKRCPV